MRILIPVLLLLGTAPHAAADGPPPPTAEVRAFLDRWAESLTSIRSLRIEFSQVKRLKILRRPRKSQGQVLMKGRRLLMRLTDARGGTESLLLVADGKVRLYYPRQQRLEEYPLDGKAPSQSPFPMFGEDVRRLPTHHTLTLTGPPEQRTLTMRPRATRSPILEAQLRFRGVRLAGMHQRSRRGETVEMTIRRFERNPKLDDALLRLSVPPGTRIVRPMGSR